MMEGCGSGTLLCHPQVDFSLTLIFSHCCPPCWLTLSKAIASESHPKPHSWWHKAANVAFSCWLFFTASLSCFIHTVTHAGCFFAEGNTQSIIHHPVPLIVLMRGVWHSAHILFDYSFFGHIPPQAIHLFCPITLIFGPHCTLHRLIAFSFKFLQKAIHKTLYNIPCWLFLILDICCLHRLI